MYRVRTTLEPCNEFGAGVSIKELDELLSRALFWSVFDFDKLGIALVLDHTRNMSEEKKKKKNG